jgi:hypothetical protein
MNRGIRVTDTMNEQIIAAKMVLPVSPIHTDISVLAPIVSGRKTMMVVRVEVITAGRISLVPTTVDSSGLAPACGSVDALQHHDGVVDQHAHGKHQAHHGENVQRAYCKYMKRRPTQREKGIARPTARVAGMFRRKK